jgi:hypothetical protein
MATEGAGGLSVAAIEWCIDGWDERDSGDGQAARAREQLAALREVAGRAAALAAALARTWDYLGHTGMCRTRQFGRCDCDLEAVLRDTKAALADAGPGAAGARDETTLCAAAMRVARLVSIVPHEILPEDWVQLLPTRKRGIVEAVKAFQALDAPRAGGAGE